MTGEHASKPSQSDSGMMRWGILVAATWVLAVTAGGRFLIGVVFDQVRDDFALTTGNLGLIVSLNVLVVGLSQPLVGRLVDRFQTRFVAAAGIGLLGLGLLVTGWADSLWVFMFGYVVLVGLGLGFVSPVVVTPLVASWFVRQRATALSIVSAGGSLGQLAIVPGLAIMVVGVGWRDSYMILGGGLVLVGVPLLLWLLRERPETNEKSSGQATGLSLREAIGQRSFWQLGLGFFVCGFTMAWITTFFVDYSLEQGITRSTAGIGLSLMGGMSIVGGLAMGWWADRAGSALPLSIVYGLRGAGFGLLLVAGTSVPVIMIAVAIVGISWSATIPLTSALCASIYGRRSLGAIFGMMFAIMPVGSAIGSALSGILHDATGSYASSILINLALGLVAAVVIIVLRPAPVFEPQLSPERASVMAD